MAARRCRGAKGRFKKCGSGGGGGGKRRGRAKRGRCLKWSKGRKRCIKRSHA